MASQEITAELATYDFPVAFSVSWKVAPLVVAEVPTL